MGEPTNKRSRIIVLVLILAILVVATALWMALLRSRGA